MRHGGPIILTHAIAACALMASVGTACAHSPRLPRTLYFEHLGMRQGLPQDTAQCIFEDPQGFVWICTQAGVARYDGQKFTTYTRVRGEHNGLPGNYARQIAEGAHGNLWIATRNGLARWNRAKNNFTVFRHETSAPHSLSASNVHAVLVEPQGSIIVATDAGVDILNPATGRVEHFAHIATNPRSLSSNQTFALMLDKKGDLWVGTRKGLDELKAGRHTFRRFPNLEGDPDGLNVPGVSVILQDADGDIWVGTLGGGLELLSPRGRLIKVFRHHAGQENSLSNNYVDALLEDTAGRLWVGTLNGLDVLDRRRGTFVRYRHDPSNPSSLSNSHIRSLYQDRTGLIWVGTDYRIDIWNPRSGKFGAHRPTWLAGTPITAFAEDAAGRLWIGSTNGLYRLNGRSGKAKSFGAVVHRPNALGNAGIMSLLYNREGLWIGTLQSGLVHLAPDGQLSSIASKPGSPYGLSDQGVMSMLRARNGTLWLGTFGGGLDALDVKTGRIRQLPYGKGLAGEVSGPQISALAQDARGDLWIGTFDGGLDLAKPDGTVIAVYHSAPDDRYSLPSNSVYALTIDAKQRLWVATSDGLALVEGTSASPKRIHFQVYSRSQGFSSNSIYGVLPDSRGRLWLSGDAGLMRFNPNTGAVKTYHREDGLTGGDFDFGAYLRLSDGKLAFGGSRGFNLFNPLSITQARRPPKLVLTNVQILGAPDPNLPAPWLAHSLRLNYRDRIVSLDVAVLAYDSPRNNRLAYRISGLTNRWIDLSAEQPITLTNLQPGAHLLEVRGANSDSDWSKPLRFNIYMSPTPWKSPWAYSLYALALAFGAFYLVRKYKLERHKQERERVRLEAMVQTRTQELTLANEQLAALSSTDGLTGLSNRRKFDDVLSNEWLRCKRGNHSLALMLIDVDWFKQYNDHYGHQAGDDCLRAIAYELAAHARRGSDIAARYGGEEFVLLSPETDVQQLRQLAEAVRRAVRERAIEHVESRNGVVTVSVGVAAAKPAEGEGPESLVRAADQALYRAKDRGRDCIEVAD